VATSKEPIKQRDEKSLIDAARGRATEWQLRWGRYYFWHYWTKLCIFYVFKFFAFCLILFFVLFINYIELSHASHVLIFESTHKLQVRWGTSSLPYDF
jgi:hypothetical protein